MSPSHAAVLLAIAPLDDLELATWTETPDRYALSPATLDLPGNKGWVLGPRDVMTPVSVLLVEDATGRLAVATGQGPTVARLLVPVLDQPAEVVARHFLTLWQEPSRPAELVVGSASLQSRGPDHRLVFDASIFPGVPKHWVVDIRSDDLRLDVE